MSTEAHLEPGQDGICKTIDTMSTTDDKVIDTPSEDTSPQEDGRDVELESVNEKTLLRKLDAQLLPAVGILYLLSFLDRSNGMSLW